MKTACVGDTVVHILARTLTPNIEADNPKVTHTDLRCRVNDRCTPCTVALDAVYIHHCTVRAL